MKVSTAILKEINQELAGSGYQIRLNPDKEHTNKYVYIENEDGDFLARAPSIVRALLDIGRRIELTHIAHDLTDNQEFIARRINSGVKS